MIDLTNPVLLGPVQNQEHYMQGVVARRNNFTEPILKFLEDAYKDFSPSFFDLIIVDECHRGSAKDDSAWRKILELAVVKTVEHCCNRM